jgi:hypothetical protein
MWRNNGAVYLTAPSYTLSVAQFNPICASTITKRKSKVGARSKIEATPKLGQCRAAVAEKALS